MSQTSRSNDSSYTSSHRQQSSISQALSSTLPTDGYLLSDTSEASDARSEGHILNVPRRSFSYPDSAAVRMVLTTGVLPTLIPTNYVFATSEETQRQSREQKQLANLGAQFEQHSSDEGMLPDGLPVNNFWPMTMSDMEIDLDRIAADSQNIPNNNAVHDLGPYSWSVNSTMDSRSDTFLELRIHTSHLLSVSVPPLKQREAESISAPPGSGDDIYTYSDHRSRV